MTTVANPSAHPAAPRLKAPEAADPEAIQRAHAVHHRACAVSRSLEGSIEIRTELELV